MVSMIKFPHIERLEDVMTKFMHETYVNSDLLRINTIHCTGTVKIHGSNFSVCQSPNGERWLQSRNFILQPDAADFEDPYGFCAFYQDRIAIFDRFFQIIREKYTEVCKECNIAIYGEFFGKEIQKDIALENVDKGYAIFSVYLVRDGCDTPDLIVPEDILRDLHEKDAQIFSVYDFPTYDLAIPVARYKTVQKSIKEIAQSIEDLCPVAKYFGVHGPGEGIVYSHIATKDEPFTIVFKVKGKRAEKTDEYMAGRKKTPKKKQEITDSMYDAIESFADIALTDARFEQGYAENKNKDDFLRWLVGDVMREERRTIAEQRLDKNALMLLLRQRGANFFDKMNSTSMSA